MNRAMAIVRWVLVAFSIVVAVGSWWSYLQAAESSATAPRYHCPMHPSIVSKDPGECPICGMDLEPIGSDRAATAAPAAAPPDAGDARFFCPMHPEVTSNEPGQRCPICKMKLEPVPSGPSSVTPVTLPLDRVQAIGVRTAIATEKESAPVLRVTATVEEPEQGVAEVHVRTPGFVERIHVRETGGKVRRGQELLALYSPEVYQAQAELLASRSFGDPVAAAGRAKLELLGVPPRTIDAIVESGKQIRAYPVVAPASGYVTKKNVVLGSYVTPETALYEIVDLSRVYVVANVFAQDATAAKVGAKATFSVSGRPELDTSRTIDLVYPSANPEARTVRVRMTVPNEKLRLVPGQVGTLAIERSAASPVVTVPRDAIVDTGEHTYVFIADAEGDSMHLTPRTVTVGAASADHVEIAKGVSAGERVVSGATFLVDSESRLRAAIRQGTP